MTRKPQPAYPVPIGPDCIASDYRGILVEDYFAAAALPTLLVNVPNVTIQECGAEIQRAVALAYVAADAAVAIRRRYLDGAQP